MKKCTPERIRTLVQDAYGMENFSSVKSVKLNYSITDAWGPQIALPELLLWILANGIPGRSFRYSLLCRNVGKTLRVIIIIIRIVGSEGRITSNNSDHFPF